MEKKLRVVLAQLNLTVGDLQANLQKHLQAATYARDELKADIIIFPELSLTSYPPEDLLLRKAFIQDAQTVLKKFTAEIKNIYCLVGHPYSDSHRLYNACSLIFNGSILARYHKQCLPNYGVFDEARYFTPGNANCVIPINDIPCGLLICEDLWRIAPTHGAEQEGAKIILSPNASPFETDKHEQRVAVLAKRSTHANIPIVYVNHVGGQDELIFDGGSMVMDAKGNVCQFAGFFQENLLVVDVNDSQPMIASAPFKILEKEERIYQALVLSLRDYVNKNHFSSVVVGLSGGIDSALTLTIAVDALGKENVYAVFLPSQYTANISLEDAEFLAKRLGVNFETISIEPAYQSFLSSLPKNFNTTNIDVSLQNIQARSRAVILMALSNKYGHLLLTTGNRSELAVGYCTLYGDMAGGFAVLKDVPKTMVYELAKYRNQLEPVIPERSIERAPTAELAPDQKDEDTLPPYSILDKILECYLNKSQSIEEIVNQGFDREMVSHIVNLIYKNEYKRKQAAIGPHINHKSFGKDWRYPITNGFKG